MTQDNLMTTREAAAYQRIRPETLANYRGSGTGPAYIRLGRKSIRYRRSDLNAYLATSRVAKGTADCWPREGRDGGSRVDSRSVTVLEPTKEGPG